MDLETFKKNAMKKEFLDPDTTLKIMERLLHMPLDMMYSNAEIEPGSNYSMIPAVLDLLKIDDSKASEISLSDLINIAFNIKDDPKDSERYSWLARYLLLWHQNYVPFMIEESPDIKKEKCSPDSDHDTYTEISKKDPVKNGAEDPDNILKIMELLLQMPLDKMYSDAELRPGYSCYKLPAVMDKLRCRNPSAFKWTLQDMINVICTDEDEQHYFGINISDYECSMLTLCLLLWHQNFVPFCKGEKNI